jgi:hypothetical protein
VKVFLLGVVVRSFFLVVTDSRVCAFWSGANVCCPKREHFSGIARFKLLSVRRDPSEHGDLCNEHTKGQQRAVSSTFRVLTQAQYQTRAVAAKKAISKRLLKFHLEALLLVPPIKVHD